MSRVRALRHAVLESARVARAYASYPRAAIGALRHRQDFDRVERFCLFLGYSRSGHTLPGAMLSAHPNAVVAHELDVLRYVEMGFDRDAIFSLLCDRDRWFCRRHCEWTGYSYAIPNQWQGRYETLRVIGDKKGRTNVWIPLSHANAGLPRRLRKHRVFVTVAHADEGRLLEGSARTNPGTDGGLSLPGRVHLRQLKAGSADRILAASKTRPRLLE